MILVNVARSWPQATTDRERLDAVEGVWPLHSDAARADRTAAAHGAAATGPAALADQEDAALDVRCLLQNDDYVLAILKNEVVDVRRIERTLILGGKVVFITSPAPEASGALGQRLSGDLAWKRGEAWPVKTADSSWLERVAATRSLELGEYKLTLAPDNALHVWAPDHGAVVVSGARGFTPDQALAPADLRAGSTTVWRLDNPCNGLSKHEEARAAAAANARAKELFAADGIRVPTVDTAVEV